MAVEKSLDHVSDPMLTLEGAVVREANAPAQQLFSADERTIEGSPLADLFPQRTGLADRYDRVLTQYQDIGGIVEGQTRHFDRERDLDFLMQVVSRVLRHNLRNDLTVAHGYAATIEERGDDSLAEMAARIGETCMDLVETSEKARYIQQAIDAAEATVETDVPDAAVRANPKLPRALTDTVENAVRYNDPPRRVEVTATRDRPWVTLTVSDNGDGIPQAELDALTHRSETDLVHGTGTGLWLTYTVVEESGGEISFDIDGDGTTVRMRLPVADSD